ncbi:Hypothetical protein NTJ_06636 [Nesidiocoris tenuis]|uniref:Uncharacterized protein n=1 Tax=Nesidiocoris tenuis TaxID=355587 RepID=A0ABN7AR57_9HEMI|nr:Hypothetical protein NTJ_06636 [Nesidiocoris tenuis]
MGAWLPQDEDSVRWREEREPDGRWRAKLSDPTHVPTCASIFVLPVLGDPPPLVSAAPLEPSPTSSDPPDPHIPKLPRQVAGPLTSDKMILSSSEVGHDTSREKKDGERRSF